MISLTGNNIEHLHVPASYSSLRLLILSEQILTTSDCINVTLHPSIAINVKVVSDCNAEHRWDAAFGSSSVSITFTITIILTNFTSAANSFVNIDELFF